MAKKKLFSIIVPVYQNEVNLDDTIPKLIEMEKELPGYNLELIFVDDGSTDRSYELLVKYYNLHRKKIKVVKLTKNFGQSPATQVGLKEANGDCIGIISADLQDPYELFIEMIKKWEAGAKLVIAERTDRRENVKHRFISSLYWKMVNKFALKDFPLGGFDFCLMDAQVKDDLNKINEKNTSIFPLIFWLGYKFEIIPYTRETREHGISQWTLAKKIRLTLDTFVGFTYLPIRIISIAGLSLAFLSFLFAFITFIRWFSFKSTVPGWTTLALLFSFLGGMILLSLGIIGEYLWRILDEARERPCYVIDKVLTDEKEDE